MIKPSINPGRRPIQKIHREARRWIGLSIVVLLCMIGVTIVQIANFALTGAGVFLVAVVVLFFTLQPEAATPVAFSRTSVTEQETLPLEKIIPQGDACLQDTETNTLDMAICFPLPVTTDPDDIDATIIRPPLAPSIERYLTVSSSSHPGIVRQLLPNEDTILVLQEIDTGHHGDTSAGLFIVADGMGGHARGREASRIAVDTIRAHLPAQLIEAWGKGEDALLNLLAESVKKANTAICAWNQANSHMGGSTLTAVLIVENKAFVANIGDSRTYLYRPGEGLRQITRDHSIVAQLVEAGEISPEDIYTHPKRNQIYRSLGEKGEIAVDTFTVDLQQLDRLLLCSDGLWEMVHDRDIERLFAHATIEQASTILLQAALDNGGADNVSVITVQISEKNFHAHKQRHPAQPDTTRALLAG